MANEDNKNSGTNVPAPWAKGAGNGPETPVAGVSTQEGQGAPDPVVKTEETEVAEVKTSTEIAPVEAKGEIVEMVTVTVPKAFKLRIDNFHEISFRAGVQEMEKAHAEHWYSKANGVIIYNPKATEEGK